MLVKILLWFIILHRKMYTTRTFSLFPIFLPVLYLNDKKVQLIVQSLLIFLKHFFSLTNERSIFLSKFFPYSCTQCIFTSYEVLLLWPRERGFWPQSVLWLLFSFSHEYLVRNNSSIVLKLLHKFSPINFRKYAI